MYICVCVYLIIYVYTSLSLPLWLLDADSSTCIIVHAHEGPCLQIGLRVVGQRDSGENGIGRCDGQGAIAPTDQSHQ